MLAFAAVALSLGLHLLLAKAVALSPQEAYYWQYARHLDLSYFDHPPLAAWTIRATTALFGDGERAVRLAAAVHGAVFALFFFLAGRRLFGGRAALLAVLAALLTPLFAMGQSIITPDAPLLSGWVAALYFTVRALDEERGPWLLAAGVAVGWAALGKYTGWLLAPQILLVLLADPRGRRLLRGPWPYLAVLVAAALFSPVVVWNARHGWASFRFQFGDRGAAMTPFSADRLGRFLGLQALAVSPVLFLALLAALVAAARRWREPGLRVCALFALPALALFTAVSPFMWVKGNWPAPAWPAALLAGSALALERWRARAVRAVAAAALGVAAAGTAYLHLAMFVPALPFPAKDDVVTGWKELAARVEEERARLPGPSFVLGCGYKPASELAYYLPGRPETYAQNAMREVGLQYDYWKSGGELLGREGLLVLDRREWRNCLRRDELCQPLEQLVPLEVRRGGVLVTTFDFWRCRYRG
ncbi:glycosyl transferase [Anaeromyxobacter diazotrophicus]|uniref:Glycosyl transferase n=1 Tax=Anaeromyxobacter diazotrophicus TaxID=2590199 RepID=A0A7I9VJ20_9BACT|nr:glycosyl transferase [Anaeromyxobacter diazotrophicus]